MGKFHPVQAPRFNVKRKADMKALILAGVLLGSVTWFCGGCSGEGETAVAAPELDPDLDPEYPYFSEEQNAAMQAAFEAEHGPVKMLDPDEQFDIDGIEAMNDMAPVQIDGNVDKTQMPIVWGWAVKGTNQMQDGDTTGPNETGKADHCLGTPQGVCDGLIHSQADDLSYNGIVDLGDDLLGRCGRFDSTTDNSWKPCIVPFGKKTNISTNKRINYAWDFASCGAIDQATKDFLNLAAGSGTVNWSTTNGTDYTYAHTALASANLIFYCTPTSEIPAGKVAIGYPFGAITPQYAADHVFDETCETPPFDPLLHAYHFADFYYSYRNFRVGIRKDDFFAFIFGCGTNANDRLSRAIKIMTHEVGHTMGFSHQQLPANGVMFNQRSCTWALNNALPNVESRAVLKDLDLDNTQPLTIYDEDISCHSPLGGGEVSQPGVTD